MKIGIYDPYLNTLGGGENYVLTLAASLSHDHDVSIIWHNTHILQDGEKRFSLDLSKVKVTPNIFVKKMSIMEKFSETKGYDAFFFMSDGSIPFLFAKKNFVIIQHPLPWVKNSIATRLKLTKIKKVLVYSEFVKRYIDKTFSINSFVLAPAVTQIPYDFRKKENIILSVGRFTQGMNTKKQAEMIDTFKRLYDSGVKGWELVLLGSSLKENAEFILSLKKSAAGYPIKVLPDVSRQLLVDYYQKAKIYWHAAGVGEDLESHPERSEHFGITTVEAMSAGAVPVVINAGGQTEIVAKAGVLWKNLSELQEETKKLIEDKDRLRSLAQQATERAEAFSKEKFNEKVQSLVS
jgi:glycosyltransferase involved in cell wall biosynthesis